MERNLAYLLPENLLRVFDETDLDKRKAAIADLWDEDGIFIDPDDLLSSASRSGGRLRCWGRTAHTLA